MRHVYILGYDRYDLYDRKKEIYYIVPFYLYKYENKMDLTSLGKDRKREFASRETEGVITLSPRSSISLRI